MHPLIATLRSGREAMILQYADLDVPKEALRVQSALQKVSRIPVDQKKRLMLRAPNWSV